MISFMRKLWKSKKGNTLAIAAACFPLFIGAAGLATDTIQWTLWKRQLQRAADSAAISGVYTRQQTNTDAAVTAAVTHDLNERLYLKTQMDLLQAPTVTRLADGGSMTNRVQVTLQVQQRLPFSSMFMSAAPIITATATAASVPDGAEYCVIAKDTGKVTGLTISGSTTLDLGTCSLIANATDPTKAASNGSSSSSGGQGSSVTAASIAAQGGINYSSSWSVTTYNPYTTPADDPFESLKSNIPSSASQCTKTGVSISNNSNIDRSTGSGADTASDTVCMSGNQAIKSNVKLGPATYVIDAGDLTMSSTSSGLSCNGCTIILTHFGNPAQAGSVKITGGTVDLSPPRSSTASDGTVTTIGNQAWKGVVLYQDPRATDGQNGSSAQNKLNGNTATSFQGVVYFGNQSLEFVGGGSDVAACLQVVAKRVTFSGNSKIKAASACGAYGLNTIGGGKRVRLVA